MSVGDQVGRSEIVGSAITKAVDLFDRESGVREALGGLIDLIVSEGCSHPHVLSAAIRPPRSILPS